MKKHPKLLRHSKLLTNHAGYCCVRAIIAQLAQVYASKCVCVCLGVKFAFLSSWGCFGRLAGANDGELATNWHRRGFSRWPFTQEAFFPSALHFLPLLVKHVRASASQHLRVCLGLGFCLHLNDPPVLPNIFVSESLQAFVFLGPDPWEFFWISCGSFSQNLFHQGPFIACFTFSALFVKVNHWEKCLFSCKYSTDVLKKCQNMEKGWNKIW